MSIAQPILRPTGSSMSSPSWLTAGASASGGAALSGGSGSGGSAGRRHEQDLINAYEAEEERIINVLSRKLEQLREDKIDLENALEAESEAHVNRLARELGALRAANSELQAQLARTTAAHGGGMLPNGGGAREPGEPGTGLLLDALQRENAGLRARLAAVEGDYARVRRLNEVYREELITHRSRLGLSVDSLIGLTSADRDPFAHPTHHRPPPTTMTTTTMAAAGPSYGVPIPRPTSQVHRPASPPRSLSTSPSSPALSPLYSASSPADSFLHRRYSSSASGATPASFVSVSTNITSPPSSAGAGAAAATAAAAFVVHGLTYPSVPPPSLSSSFGSPSVPLHVPLSPTEPRSRRGSGARRGSIGAGERRVVETGSLRRGGERTAPIPIGGRVAEAGALAPRGHANGLPATVVEDDDDGLEDMDLGGPDVDPDGVLIPPVLSRTYGLDLEGTPSAKSR